MIPLRDDQPCFTTPFVTYFLIALNVLIFFATFPSPSNRLAYEFGFTPAVITAIVRGATHVQLGRYVLPVDPASALVTFVTSMFLHGSFMHVAGNMLFLYIFGDNIEDYLGHFRFLLFYMLGGVLAAFAHLVLNADSTVPTVGASGAIAAVMGAYLILYPHARVLMWFPPIFLFRVPAWLMLGYWALTQFLNGAATSLTVTNQAGGIAFWAHAGGFLAGVLLIKLIPERKQRYRYASW